MSSQDRGRICNEAETLDQGTASRLLGMGLEPQGRPLDKLVDRLERADGDAWLARALASEPFTSVGDPCAALLNGSADRAALMRLKEQGASLAKTGRAPDERLRGVLAYFLANAGAVVHLGARLTSRSPAELGEALLDLATVMPAPWSDLLARASDACESQQA